jgi:hypothetical protein
MNGAGSGLLYPGMAIPAQKTSQPFPIARSHGVGTATGGYFFWKTSLATETAVTAFGQPA